MMTSVISSDQFTICAYENHGSDSAEAYGYIELPLISAKLKIELQVLSQLIDSLTAILEALSPKMDATTWRILSQYKTNLLSQTVGIDENFGLKVTTLFRLLLRTDIEEAHKLIAVNFWLHSSVNLAIDRPDPSLAIIYLKLASLKEQQLFLHVYEKMIEETIAVVVIEHQLTVPSHHTNDLVKTILQKRRLCRREPSSIVSQQYRCQQFLQVQELILTLLDNYITPYLFVREVFNQLELNNERKFSNYLYHQLFHLARNTNCSNATALDKLHFDHPQVLLIFITVLMKDEQFLEICPLTTSYKQNKDHLLLVEGFGCYFVKTQQQIRSLEITDLQNCQLKNVPRVAFTVALQLINSARSTSEITSLFNEHPYLCQLASPQKSIIKNTLINKRNGLQATQATKTEVDQAIQSIIMAIDIEPDWEILA
ncbi:MAG: hypothetical protein ACPGUD_08980 [Parashewanella sp.]